MYDSQADAFLDLGDRICTCGVSTNKDELMKCFSCGTSTCPYCNTTITINDTESKMSSYIVDAIKKAGGFKEMPYSQSLCPDCLSKYSIQFILQIPVLELPLYINHDWEDANLAKVYRARLAGESIVEPT
jgi:hypothetical protein